MGEQTQSQVFRNIGFDVMLATTDATKLALLPRTLGMLTWVSIGFHNNIARNWPKLRNMLQLALEVVEHSPYTRFDFLRLDELWVRTPPSARPRRPASVYHPNVRKYQEVYAERIEFACTITPWGLLSRTGAQVSSGDGSLELIFPQARQWGASWMASYTRIDDRLVTAAFNQCIVEGYTEADFTGLTDAVMAARGWVRDPQHPLLPYIDELLQPFYTRCNCRGPCQNSPRLVTPASAHEGVAAPPGCVIAPYARLPTFSGMNFTTHNLAMHELKKDLGHSKFPNGTAVEIRLTAPYFHARPCSDWDLQSRYGHPLEPTLPDVTAPAALLETFFPVRTVGSGLPKAILGGRVLGRVIAAQGHNILVSLDPPTAGCLPEHQPAPTPPQLELSRLSSIDQLNAEDMARWKIPSSYWVMIPARDVFLRQDPELAVRRSVQAARDEDIIFCVVAEETEDGDYLTQTTQCDAHLEADRFCLRMSQCRLIPLITPGRISGLDLEFFALHDQHGSENGQTPDGTLSLEEISGRSPPLPSGLRTGQLYFLRGLSREFNLFEGMRVEVLRGLDATRRVLVTSCEPPDSNFPYLQGAETNLRSKNTILMEVHVRHLTDLHSDHVPAPPAFPVGAQVLITGSLGCNCDDDSCTCDIPGCGKPTCELCSQGTVGFEGTIQDIDTGPTHSAVSVYLGCVSKQGPDDDKRRRFIVPNDSLRRTDLPVNDDLVGCHKEMYLMRYSFALLASPLTYLQRVLRCLVNQYAQFNPGLTTGHWLRPIHLFGIGCAEDPRSVLTNTTRPAGYSVDSPNLHPGNRSTVGHLARGETLISWIFCTDNTSFAALLGLGLLLSPGNENPLELMQDPADRAVKQAIINDWHTNDPDMPARRWLNAALLRRARSANLGAPDVLSVLWTTTACRARQQGIVAHEAATATLVVEPVRGWRMPPPPFRLLSFGKRDWRQAWRAATDFGLLTPGVPVWVHVSMLPASHPGRWTTQSASEPAPDREARSQIQEYSHASGSHWLLATVVTVNAASSGFTTQLEAPMCVALLQRRFYGREPSRPNKGQNAYWRGYVVLTPASSCLWPLRLE
jgi:hypothetical protein